MRSNAIFCASFRKRKDGIYRTTGFEGTCLLQILTLEQKAAAYNLIKLLTRLNRGPMNVRCNSFMGGPDITDGD
jgi:hypothetical protein